MSVKAPRAAESNKLSSAYPQSSFSKILYPRCVNAVCNTLNYNNTYITGNFVRDARMQWKNTFCTPPARVKLHSSCFEVVEVLFVFYTSVILFFVLQI